MTTSMSHHDRDRATARSATGLLATFNQAGVLSAADVHVATTLARLASEPDEHVALAAALASRAVRHGSVAVDLRTIATDAAPPPLEDADGDLELLPWPDAATWTDVVAVSALAQQRALVVEHGVVYLQRYHHQEVQVVADLHARAAQVAPPVDGDLLDRGLARVFPGAGFAEQRAAAHSSVHAWTSIITGGPGTGKTTTVAGVLALLAEQAAAAGQRPLHVGLAAPTGKAAARVRGAVAEALSGILSRTPEDATRAVIAPIGDVEATTLHRLLGWNPHSRTRFRHHRGNRLPHDVILVDEASMVSLTHMARLLEAVRPTARLILVGDADQLVSVDAGAVLADLVAAAEDSSNPPIALARLRTVHRFGARIGRLAEALRRGDADMVVATLRSPDESATGASPSTDASSAGSPGPDPDGSVQWIEEADPLVLRPLLTAHARTVHDAASAGDSGSALAALGAHRLLCAHREGPYGVRRWNQLTQLWLQEETGTSPYETMYIGRPVLVTKNDYAVGVLNGDTGVIVASRRPDGTPVRMAAFEGARGEQRFAPSRLGEIETMHAMTVHKAQGSQAAEVTVLLPDTDSRLLTRELLYTAVTRAQQTVRIVGSEAVVRAAVGRRVVRSSGLRTRLAGPPTMTP